MLLWDPFKPLPMMPSSFNFNYIASSDFSSLEAHSDLQKPYFTTLCGPFVTRIKLEECPFKPSLHWKFPKVPPTITAPAEEHSNTMSLITPQDTVSTERCRLVPVNRFFRRCSMINPGCSDILVH